MKGLIFSIKRYTIHDGPGIRVTFFMKGCPLNCSWCHNPEGISPEQQRVKMSDMIGEKEFGRDEEVGKYYSADDIIEILSRDRVFMEQSKGGVTFSGGEPMLQTGFLLAVLKACKTNGYHTAIDTSGYSSPENFKLVIPYTDLFLFDIKHLDDDAHFRATGVSNTDILGNYKLLLQQSAKVIVRVPVIPGFNDDNEHMDRVIRFIISNKTESLKKINLLPYHKTGSSKYRKFNIPYHMENILPPSKDYMLKLKEKFLITGVKVKIGG